MAREPSVAARISWETHLALCFQDGAEPRREHGGTHRTDVLDELDEPMLATFAIDHPPRRAASESASPTSPTTRGSPRRATD